MNAKGKGLIVPVNAQMRGDELEIKVGAGKGKANVVVVYFDREKTWTSKKGENSGQEDLLSGTPCGDVETIGMWDGKADVLPLPAILNGEVGTIAAAPCCCRRDERQRSGRAILGATTVMADRPARLTSQLVRPQHGGAGDSKTPARPIVFVAMGVARSHGVRRAGPDGR